MQQATYTTRRREIERYFAHTAAETWSKLTSEAPVGRIRQTVRAGRDSMRDRLLSWLPNDLRGARVLDAGCGTGALSVEAARRGARVVAIDLSEPLITLARRRLPADIDPAAVTFRNGDMLDPDLGSFDHVVAMDSLIHYDARDMAWALSSLAARTGASLHFTFAPKTPVLAAMHAVGKLFPKGNKAPSIQPVSQARIRKLVEREPGLEGWLISRTARIKSGFYISEVVELCPT